MKRLHYLQHVKFEDLNYIESWASANNFTITKTKLYENPKFPSHNDYDWLIILGGPMNVYQYNQYPWLKPEIEFISQAIRNDKTIVGICLGAQLIAFSLGAKVYKNNFTEIGWFTVKQTDKSTNSKIFKTLPAHFQAFHWHGDTFDIPQGAVHTVSSAACDNQAFEYNDGKIIGLQFHLESTPESVNSLISNCANEITEGKFIQPEKKIITGNHNIKESNEILTKLFNNLNKL